MGVAVVEKSVGEFKRGEKRYLLSYRGEGNYYLWHKGRMISDESGVISSSKKIQAPTTIWWVLVRNKDGRQGWLMLENVAYNGFGTKEIIYGMDIFG